VANAFAFDAYGNLIASSAAAQTTYLYTCQQFHPDLGSYYLRARTYEPGTGRFPTSDDGGGNQEEPASLHRYAYCAGDPVDGTDLSGRDTMIEITAASYEQADLRSRAGAGQANGYQRGVSIQQWNNALSSYQGAVQGSAVYKGAAITVAAMVAAGHLAMVWEALDPEQEEWDRAEKKLKADVEEAAKEKGCNGRVLYYYRDAPRVAWAYKSRTLTGSAGAPQQGFPEGGYASDIPPWDQTYTQIELAEGFFGAANKYESVEYFVAFCDDGTWNPLPNTITPGILHWHKYGKAGRPVPINVICAGVNLMR